MDIFDPYGKLKRILGPSPTHPWGALIPQALLWSFRRFCIQKLIVQEGTLMDYLWEDHLELIHSYGPKGLEMASIDWLVPENIGHMSSSLESYNAFFISIMRMIDIVMEDNDYKMQDTISEFLDTGMGEYIYKWLGGKFLPFLIFPMKIEDDNEFTSSQFSRLISNLMEFSAKLQAQAKLIKEAAAAAALPPPKPLPPPKEAAPLVPPKPLPPPKEVVPLPPNPLPPLKEVVPLELPKPLPPPKEVVPLPLLKKEIAPLELPKPLPPPKEVVPLPPLKEVAPLELPKPLPPKEVIPLELPKPLPPPKELAPLPPPIEEPPPPPPPPPPAPLNPFDFFMPSNSLLWQYASLPSMVSDAYKEAKPVMCVQPEEPVIKTVREAIKSRRLTIKKNGRYSRVKTKRRHLN